MALVGLMVRTPEVVNNASFIVIFPLTFVANTFVPLETFPPCCRRSPSGTRCPRSPRPPAKLFGNSPAPPDVWSLQHPVLYSVLWGSRSWLVFVPLSVRKYRNTASR